MATLRASLTQSPKQKLSHTMRSWLPILQADIEGLSEALEPFKETNPFLEIKAGSERSSAQFKKKNFFDLAVQNSTTETIEALSLEKESLYDMLFKQINPPLFPTKKSQNIAYKIIEYINKEGYFEFEKSILEELECTKSELEKIRARFSKLEPAGIGAKDFKEAFLFQLENITISDECYKSAKKLISDFENIESKTKTPNFNEVMEIIKTFRIPPGIDFLEDAREIIPDFFVYEKDGNIQISINDDYYPEINLDVEGLNEEEEYIASKIKEGKELVDALEMRKATLYKIGLNIIEHQYDFFYGGEIKPMTLRSLATQMERNPSTISRAISGKYLSCKRGLFALKDFFTTAIDEETSNSTIKEYITENISYENHLKPLSDMKLLKMVENNFGIQLSRRTITKYRKQLNIAGSSERKRLYKLQGN